MTVKAVGNLVAAECDEAATDMVRRGRRTHRDDGLAGFPARVVMQPLGRHDPRRRSRQRRAHVNFADSHELLAPPRRLPG